MCGRGGTEPRFELGRRHVDETVELGDDVGFGFHRAGCEVTGGLREVVG